REPQMLARDAKAIPTVALAQDWLRQFEQALMSDPASLKALFHADSYWRDVLALTWRITTICGASDIGRELRTHASRARPAGFRIDPDRTPPRLVTRAGIEAVEVIFAFDTAEGRGSGVLRLTSDDDDPPRAWTLLTVLDDLKGFEEQIGRSRPNGAAYSRTFPGPNGLDQRRASAAYADRDPEVLVVGAGQAGLSIAARLTQLGVDTLMIDRERRVGDNWRHRYHALTLHNQVHVNHLPYMP